MTNSYSKRKSWTDADKQNNNFKITGLRTYRNSYAGSYLGVLLKS